MMDKFGVGPEPARRAEFRFDRPGPSAPGGMVQLAAGRAEFAPERPGSGPARELL